MAQRAVGKAVDLDLLGIRIHSGHAGQCLGSPHRAIRSHPEIPASRRNRGGGEPAVLSTLAMLALREGYVSGWKAVAYSLIVSGLLLLSIPGLFGLGKALQL